MNKLVKLIIVSIIVSSLFGCRSNEKEIKSFNFDMSVYKTLNKEDFNNFKGITLASLKDIIQNKKSCFVFVCYADSNECHNDIKVISDLAKQYEKTIYCIDAKAILKDANAFKEMLELLDPVLEDEQGFKLISAPELIKIENGEFVDFVVKPNSLEVYESIIGGE